MPAIDNINNSITSIPMTDQGSTPTTPTSGKTRIYTKSDGLYIVNSSGTVTGPIVLPHYPSRTGRMFHGDSIITVGNAFTYAANSGYLVNGIWYQDAPANGDTFTHSFMLAAGTYTLFVNGKVATNNALIDWYFDDVKVVSLQDWYGVSTDNVTKTSASLTITGSGRHVIKGVVNGKNGSSSNYYMQLCAYWLMPASDTASV